MMIKEGEVVSFLGPSGRDKPTALKVIAGFLPIFVSTITIAPPKAKSEQDMAFGFQEPTPMARAMVADNVFLPLRLAGVSRADAPQPVTEALAEVGLSRFARFYPSELPGGMEMRVSIARAKLNKLVVQSARLHELAMVFVIRWVFEAVYLSTRVDLIAARPGRVAADRAQETPWHRNEKWRLVPAFSAEAARGSETLKGALHVDGIDH